MVPMLIAVMTLARTALMAASLKGRTAIAELLIKNGADVHKTDSGGRTALDIAEKRKPIRYDKAVGIL